MAGATPGSGKTAAVTAERAAFAGSLLDAPGPDQTPDPLFAEWHDQRSGPFTTNGTLAAYITRSSVAKTDPDLFVFSLPVFFRGYYPDYSVDFRARHDVVSWAVLKGPHQQQLGSGRIAVRGSAGYPRDQLRLLRGRQRHDRRGPGSGCRWRAVRPLAGRPPGRYGHRGDPARIWRSHPHPTPGVRANQAWGHHASCTVKIGADNDPTAVLDSQFRVRGVDGLRVVDASAFPRIPGFFIASAVYMIAEKASDLLLAQYGSPHHAASGTP